MGIKYSLPVILITIFILLALSASHVPITRDEPVNLRNTENFKEWIKILFTHPSEAFKPEILEKGWHSEGHHPSITRWLMAISQAILGKCISELTAARLVSWLFYIFLICVVYLFLRIDFDVFPALAGAWSILLLPRVWGQSLLASTYTPLVFFWFFSLFAIIKSENSKCWKWIILPISLGLMLSTKSTGLLIIFPLVWYFLKTNDTLKNKILHPIIILILSAFVLYITWPWLWSNPLGRIWEHIEAGKAETGGLTFLWGKHLDFIPWYYTFLMTFLTTPLILILSAFWSLYIEIRNPKKTVILLIITFIIYEILFLSQPKLGIHGVRYFIPALIALAMFGGIGLFDIFERLIKKYNLYKLPKYIIHILIIIYALIQLWIMSPNYLSYYNILLGGSKSASENGWEFRYWEESIYELNKIDSSHF